jgi:hypothetical protein
MVISSRLPIGVGTTNKIPESINVYAFSTFAGRLIVNKVGFACDVRIMAPPISVSNFLT